MKPYFSDLVDGVSVPEFGKFKWLQGELCIVAHLLQKVQWLSEKFFLADI